MDTHPKTILETSELTCQRSPLCHRFIQSIPDLAKEYSCQLQLAKSIDHDLIQNRQNETKLGCQVSFKDARQFLIAGYQILADSESRRLEKARRPAQTTAPPRPHAQRVFE